MPATHTHPCSAPHSGNRDLWRRLAARYEWLVERIVPRAEAFFETCLSFVPSGPHAVLELGSGTGYASERLPRRNPQARLTCLDLSPDMLRAAKAKRALKKVRFVEGDIRGDWPDGRFDVVFTTLCLHHLTPGERGQVMAKARATLRRQGRFINGDIFKPATSWEERLLRQHWLQRLRAQGLSGPEADEMLAKRRRNLRCFDTVAGHQCGLREAGFRRILCPWICEMSGVFVAFP